MKKKKQDKYNIYEDKMDAFLSGYAEADVIQTFIDFMAFDREDFLLFVLKDFVRRNKESKDKIK